ncbi:hypothetical protein BC829DRAFT_418551 [Chytridium lagenaria]|nr:hypothetical protein BC829DRAFT_418551 [Chytridium lagenaria]
MASAWLESQERRIRADDETVKSRPSRTTSKASPDASPLAAQHRVTSTSHDVTSQPSKTTQPNVNIKPPKSTIHESLIPTRVSTATASNRTHHSPSHDSHPPPSRSSTAKSAFRASKAFSDTSSIDLTSMSDRPSLATPPPSSTRSARLPATPNLPSTQTSPQSPSSPHSIHPPPSNFGSMSVNPSQWSFLSRLKRPTTIRTPSPRSSRSSTSSKWPHSRRTSYSSTEEFRVGTTSPSESLVRQRRGSGVSSLAAFAALQASQHVDRPRRASWAHGSGGFPIGSAEFGRAGRSVVAPGNVVALAVADSVLPGKPRRLGEVEAQSVEVKEKILPLVKAAAVTLPWRSRLASGGRGIEEKLDSTSRSKSRVSFAVNGEGTVKTGVVSLQDEGAVRTMKGIFNGGMR